MRVSSQMIILAIAFATCVFSAEAAAKAKEITTLEISNNQTETDATIPTFADQTTSFTEATQLATKRARKSRRRQRNKLRGIPPNELQETIDKELERMQAIKAQCDWRNGEFYHYSLKACTSCDVACESEKNLGSCAIECAAYFEKWDIRSKSDWSQYIAIGAVALSFILGIILICVCMNVKTIKKENEALSITLEEIQKRNRDNPNSDKPPIQANDERDDEDAPADSTQGLLGNQ